MSAVIELHEVTKRFPGVVALDRVSAELREREVLGLIGQNGSGKSTLLKLLAGVQQPDAGTLSLRGEPLSLGSVERANAHGIGMVFQEQSLVPGLSVAENIFLGKPTGAKRGGVYRWRRLRREAQRQLDKVASPVSPSARVEQLDFAQRQMVELAKVLALEELTDRPLVVLLDEPTSVLNREETEALFAQVRRLKQRSSVVFVSHRLEEVLAISDRVYVMSDGRRVAECEADAVDTQDLYRLMVGEDRAEDYYLGGRRADPPASGSAPRLRVEALSVRGGCRDVSFEVGAGEVLGLTGVVGSGREAVCRALVGAEPIARGKVALEGAPLRLASPAAAVAAGIGYVPAERKVEGMLAGRSVHENVVIAAGPALRRGPLLAPRRESARVAQLLDQLHVKTPSPRVRIDALSGGNQQKVVLAKWLAAGRLRLLVLDHPTRGLDLRAKSDVYALVRELTASGVAVVLLSDTLEETLGLSDRLVVLRDGTVSGRFDAVASDPPQEEELMELMV
jgi:ribose transport system ATP-binding protein